MTKLLVNEFDRALLRRAGVRTGRARKLSPVAAQAVLCAAAVEEIPLFRTGFPVEATLARIAGNLGLQVLCRDGVALVRHVKIRGKRDVRFKLLVHNVQRVVFFGPKGFEEAEIHPRVRVGGPVGHHREMALSKPRRQIHRAFSSAAV